MRVSRRTHDKSDDARAQTADDGATVQPAALASPLHAQNGFADHQDAVPIHKPSTRVWKLKKYRNTDPEAQSSLMQGTKNSPDGAKAGAGKKASRKLPPRRPKTDKNGNPLEFVFVDASPQQGAVPQFPVPGQGAAAAQVQKRQGIFAKNIFRLSSGSRKSDHADIGAAAMAPTVPTTAPAEPVPAPPLAPEQHQFGAMLKASNSLQDMTCARRQSVSSIGRATLKRSFTSVAQQSRLPQAADLQQQDAGARQRSDSSLSMVYIKIDDNGRAVVAHQPQPQPQSQPQPYNQNQPQQAHQPHLQMHQPQLSKTISSSSSASELSATRQHLVLNSSRRRSPPASGFDSPVLASQSFGGSGSGNGNAHPVSASTTPYSLSATDDDDDDDDARVAEDFSTATAPDQDNDALVAFTKVMGSKRKQLSRKSSTVSISSNLNNMTLTNGTPVQSPVLTGPVHNRSLSSLSVSGVPLSGARRPSPVRTNSRRLRHSQSVSLAGSARPFAEQQQQQQQQQAAYYQSGIHNSKPAAGAQAAPLQAQMAKQAIQQTIYYPLGSSSSLYNLNVSDNSRHNSNDSSSYDTATVHSGVAAQTLGPALDLTTSFTTGSVSSIATPTSPEHPRQDAARAAAPVPPLYRPVDQTAQLQQFLFQPADMDKLNSSDSTRTLLPQQQFAQQLQHQPAPAKQRQAQDPNSSAEFMNSLSFNDSAFYSDAPVQDDAFDLFDFISYDNNASNGYS